MATKTWNDGVADWKTAADWTQPGVPGATDDVVITTGTPRIIGEDVGTVSSITSNSLVLSDGKLATVGTVTNTGQLLVEPYAATGGAGSTLTIGGTLSNTGNALLQIGNTSASGMSTVTVNGAGGITNTGYIEVYGGDGQSTLNISHAAAGFGTAGHVTGTIIIQNNALVEFASGGFTNIDAGAQLSLIGAQSRLAIASDTTTNSSLMGLTRNDGTLSLDSTTIATVTGTNFTNTGLINIDTPGLGGGNDSGGTLTIGGTLTNTGLANNSQGIFIGNTFESGGTTNVTVEGAGGLINTGSISLTGNTTLGTTHQTTLNVANAAAGFGTVGHLTGSLSLNGDALLEFKSGGITNIDNGASLLLSGAQSRLAVATGNSATNSALTGLTANNGSLTLQSGATLATNAGQNFTTTGRVVIGTGSNGSSLAIGGALINSAGQTTGFNIFNGSVSANGLVDTGFITFTGASAAASTLMVTGGTSSISGTVAGTGTLALTGGTMTITSSAAVSVSNVSLGGTATLEDATSAAGFTSAIAFASNAAATLKVDATALPNGQTLANAITGFAIGDTIDLAGLKFSGTATATVSNGVLAVTENGVTDKLMLSLPNGTIVNLKADAAGTGTNVYVCYVAGTQIRTPTGDVAVECLDVGDLVVTSSGAHRPIRWLGHRTVDCRRCSRRGDALPVRIAAHAFGENRPARDLFVSPGHSICVDLIGEVLIPAIALINGSTVQQVEVEAVTYWHIELDSHDILLAEGLPAESYLDMGNRGFFKEADVVDLVTGPDARPARRTHADFCRPFHVYGPVVETVRARSRCARR